MVGDFSNPLSLIDRTTRSKILKDTELQAVNQQICLIFIYTTFNNTQQKKDPHSFQCSKNLHQDR